MVLNMSGRLMVASCLTMEMTSQVYIMVNWLRHYGKILHLSFVLFVLLFVLRVIFFWGNFATCFFQSDDKWEYTFNTDIFISDFTYYYFFT